MPTALSHPAPVLALAVMSALVRHAFSWRLLVFAAILSVLPDVDVVAFALKIPYANILGHRGITHSLGFAFLAGLCGMALAPFLHCKRIAAFCVSFFAVAAHVLLDAMTNGGLGVAAFWPFDHSRWFLPWRPIRVSPIGARFLLSSRGAAVLFSELLWIWVPCFAAVGCVGGMASAFGPREKRRRVTD